MTRAPLIAMALFAATALVAAPAAAQDKAKPKAQFSQDSKNPSLGDTFKGLGSGSKDPIQIEADGLEVKDKDNMAIFKGNVVVRQKETVLKTQVLRVFYEQKTAKDPNAPKSAAGDAPSAQNQQIKRYEAEGGVLINQKDQTVTGETGWFDMPTNKAQINRNVVVTQGNNVGKGERLDVDLTTGQYTMSGGGSGARPIWVLEPAKGDDAKSKKP